MAAEQEAMALRAKIQAMRNLLEVQQRQNSYHRPHSHRRRALASFGPVANQRAGRFQRYRPMAKPTNLVWKNESVASSAKSNQVSKLGGGKQRMKWTGSSVKVPRVQSPSSLSVKRTLSRMQLRVVKLEDGEYAKANGGFSLVRSGVPLSKTYLKSTLPKLSHSSMISRANVVLQRAKQLRSKASKVKTRTEYCLFFNRFGFCKNEHACKYIHDSRKVAVCRKLMKGGCTDPACRLSHTFDKNKMPVCTLFLKGRCMRDDCKFRHVKVSASAQLCKAFLRGYCKEGAACKLKHELPSRKKTSLPVSRRSIQSASATVAASAPAVATTSLSPIPSTSERRESITEQTGTSVENAAIPCEDMALVAPVGSLAIRPALPIAPANGQPHPFLNELKSLHGKRIAQQQCTLDL